MITYRDARKDLLYDSALVPGLASPDQGTRQTREAHSGQQQRHVYFRANVRAVPPQRVYEMVVEVRRRVGADRCHIDITKPDAEGWYTVVFHQTQGADMFEALYRQTGQVPQRIDGPPEGIRIIVVEEWDVVVRGGLSTFMQYMQRQHN